MHGYQSALLVAVTERAEVVLSTVFLMSVELLQEIRYQWHIPLSSNFSNPCNEMSGQCWGEATEPSKSDFFSFKIFSLCK